MEPRTTQRPWGEFRQFADNEPVTVKILTVRKGESLSLQYHHNRSEFWKVLSGNPSITIGTVVTEATVGEEFVIPATAEHRISAGATDATLLEIARGSFDESDIVRLEDAYGRV